MPPKSYRHCGPPLATSHSVLFHLALIHCCHSTDQDSCLLSPNPQLCDPVTWIKAILLLCSKLSPDSTMPTRTHRAAPTSGPPTLSSCFSLPGSLCSYLHWPPQLLTAQAHGQLQGYGPNYAPQVRCGYGAQVGKGLTILQSHSLQC